HIVQGERPLAKDNVSLGMFNLEGIPPAPRGVPQIEVTFDIDANGILNVTAKDLGTGKQNSITITSSTKLSKEQIEKMKKEAEQFAEQDRKRKEEIETLNNAESLVYSSEKFINEYKEKLPKEDVEKAREIISNLKDFISQKNIEKTKEKMKELENIVQNLGASMYKNVGQKSQEKDTVETEYKENKEKND
ncbi:MAG: Hsp70 family protein, partial [Thermoplasmata archaeon]